MRRQRKETAWRKNRRFGDVHGGRMSPKLTDNIFSERGWWYTEFDLGGLRRFYVEHLVYHEVGHHVDLYHRRWSAANHRQCEDFADQYAVSFSHTAAIVLSRLDPRGEER